jgi:hypothetical protein
MKRLILSALLFATFAVREAPAQLATGVDYNAATPAAPAGARNVIWQNDSNRPTVHASAYVTYPTLQIACPTGSDLSTAVNAMLAYVPTGQGGILDARACNANYTWNSATTINTPNTVILLPCGTLTVTQPFTVTYGIRNVAIHGCSYQGGSNVSGTSGGTVWNWQGSGSAFIIGDPADNYNTGGFVITDMAITTPSAGASAHAIDFHRVTEIDFERVYLIGNATTGQTGLTLDGTGNYSGGQFIGVHIASFGTAVTMTGTSAGAANASTFVRLHIDCATSSGSPIAGTVGINLAYGDGNTFTGGDVESCDTMLALGAGAANNTFIGVRNENSNTQVAAAAGSSYNLWETGGTMFTGRLTDSGTHNTFWDAFHRQFNNLNGDLWRSQADATITNHVYTGIGLGNVRGRQDGYITDVPNSPGSYQNAWLWGPGDGTTGAQVWVLTDLLANVPRFGASQTTAGRGNDQTFLNSTGSAAVCINCSGGAGTSGFSVSGGGATPATVWQTDGSGNTTQNGYQRFWASGAEVWRFSCATYAACGISAYTGGIGSPHIRMFGGSGTELDSESTYAVTVNNTSGSGTGGFIVYEGGSNSGVAAFIVTGAGATSQPGNSQIGSASGTGNLTIGSHLNQLATTDFAGHCTMTTTTCTVSFQHSWTSTPACTATVRGTSPFYAAVSVTTNVATVTANASNTATWNVICPGDPN